MQSIELLDNKRLNRQRQEAIQIFKINAGEPYKDANQRVNRGYYNHPACVMYRAHPLVLRNYIYNVCVECNCRSIADNTGAADRYDLSWLIYSYKQAGVSTDSVWQRFVTEVHPLFFSAHRTTLHQKDPNYYTQEHLGEELVRFSSEYLYKCMWPSSDPDFARIYTPHKFDYKKRAFKTL